MIAYQINILQANYFDMSSKTNIDENNISTALHRQFQVLYALMLRDIRTRFFGNGLGFLFSMGWPLTHILVLLIIYSMSNRIAPIGDNLILFFAVGVTPFMAFQYMSRFILLGIILNKPLISFPIVKLLDIVLARAILEVLASCSTTAIVMIGLYLYGVDPVPYNAVEAISAMAATFLLGLGVGILNAVIVTAFIGWMTGYFLLIIVLWMSSGILFLPSSLPVFVQTIISYNPTLHAVEWMRTAYFMGYTSTILDKGYLISWGVGTLFSGLVLERLIRRRLLQG